MFSWHTLGSLISVDGRLDSRAYLRIVADHDYPFMAADYLMAEGPILQDKAPYHKVIVMEVPKEVQ